MLTDAYLVFKLRALSLRIWASQNPVKISVLLVATLLSIPIILQTIMWYLFSISEEELRSISHAISPSIASNLFTVRLDLRNDIENFVSIINHYAACRSVLHIHVFLLATSRYKTKASLLYSVDVRYHDKISLELCPHGGRLHLFQVRPIANSAAVLVLAPSEDGRIPMISDESLSFGFRVWKSAPKTMVGYLPYLIVPNVQETGVTVQNVDFSSAFGWYNLVKHSAVFIGSQYTQILKDVEPELIPLINQDPVCLDLYLYHRITKSSQSSMFPVIWIFSNEISFMKHRNTAQASECVKLLQEKQISIPMPSENIFIDSTSKWRKYLIRDF